MKKIQALISIVFILFAIGALAGLQYYLAQEDERKLEHEYVGKIIELKVPCGPDSSGFYPTYYDTNMSRIRGFIANLIREYNSIGIPKAEISNVSLFGRSGDRWFSLGGAESAASEAKKLLDEGNYTYALYEISHALAMKKAYLDLRNKDLPSAIREEIDLLLKEANSIYSKLLYFEQHCNPSTLSFYEYWTLGVDVEMSYRDKLERIQYYEGRLSIIPEFSAVRQLEILYELYRINVSLVWINTKTGILISRYCLSNSIDTYLRKTEHLYERINASFNQLLSSFPIEEWNKTTHDLRETEGMIFISDVFKWAKNRYNLSLSAYRKGLRLLALADLLKAKAELEAAKEMLGKLRILKDKNYVILQEVYELKKKYAQIISQLRLLPLWEIRIFNRMMFGILAGNLPIEQTAELSRKYVQFMYFEYLKSTMFAGKLLEEIQNIK